MEGAKDPDEYIVKYGNARFKKLIDNALSVIEFKVKVLKQNLNLDNTNDKIKFLNEIAKLISKIDNTIERVVYIEKIAKEYDIEPEEIELEITETTEIGVEIDKQLGITEILKKIKVKGFKISIDDFGTGYSSLNMLQDMPVDVIKIDKSFINQEKMLEIIMMMAKNLNLKTVAEGVETEKQVEILKDLGVNLLQGYYFSKPLKKIEFEKYWQNN